MYDYIIVGQGISGTLLAHFLLQQKKNILIVDAVHAQAASRVAAGLINPITGRHFVKTWMIDELLPTAVETYRALEELLGISILEESPLVRVISDTKSYNDWLVRSSNPDLHPYVDAPRQTSAYSSFLKEVQQVITFKQTSRVRMNALIEAYRPLLKEQATYAQEIFDYASFQLLEEGVQYKNWKAKRIIFAEGYRAIYNPYFNYMPFWPAKGDVLLVKIPNYPATNELLKHGVFIVPLSEPDLYWVGSSYQRNYTSTEPEQDARQTLEQRLQRILQLPFEVVEHKVAVRPTVRDRRPFIGPHPEHPALYLFNGMGAKGASLAPFWAKALVDHLELGRPLDKSVHLSRYLRYFHDRTLKK
ncbi:MAG: NAD(P)/FAD-dependent oxidoreductase [Aureispira sp.]